MKIQAITLKEFEVVEVNGHFERRLISSKKYPACLTHKSLQLGKDLGILQSSKMVSVLGFDEIDPNITEKEEKEAANEAINDFDVLRYVQIIYLALIGFNKNLDLSYEEFLEKYDESTETTMDIFTKLIEGYLSSGDNNFAKGLQRSTKKKYQKNNKSNHQR